MFNSIRWAILLIGACAAKVSAVEVEKFLPKDTDLVLSVNVRQALDSQLGKQFAPELIKSALAANQDLQEAIKILGLDPMKDCARLTVGLSLEDLNKPTGVVVVEGKFDVKKIADGLEALARNEPKKFAVEKSNGNTIYRMTAPNQTVPVFIAPVDATILVLTTAKDSAGAAYDAVKGTRKSEIKPELADLLKKADPKSSLTAVAYIKGRLGSINLPDTAMKKAIEQTQYCHLDLKIEKDIVLEAALVAASADTAKQMQLLLGATIDLARFQVKAALAQQPELMPLTGLLNSMKAVQRDKAVVITGHLDGAAVEKMLKKAK